MGTGMRLAWIAACLGTTLTVGAPARADLLVDTGPGGTSSIGALSLFNDGPASYQFLAGKFTLTTSAELDSVEGWMSPFGTGGDIAIKIRADGVIPGNPIFSKSYTLGFRLNAGWDLFADYDVALPAGSYWLSFEPVAGTGMNYSMPPGAPSPLASYSFLAGGNPGWIQLSPNPGLGMRVSGEPLAAAPLGTGTRTIVTVGPNQSDRLRGAQGEQETLDWNINLSGHGWSSGVGTIYANWLQAGAAAACSQALNAARAVAFRSFENTTAQPLTFRVNAVLDGGFEDSFGSTTLAATGGIHALDSELFASTVAASGVGAAEYLLREDSLNPTTGAADRVSLAVLFPPPARLASATVEIPFQGGPVSVPLQTALITIDPQQVFTLLFDVSALAAGTGTGATLFYNTLEPAPVLFTDAGGSPVTGIDELGQGVIVGEAAFLMWEPGAKNTLSWQTAVGASQYRLYRGAGPDLPALASGAADSCLRYQDGATTSGPLLTEEPLPGEHYWYLVTGVDGPSEGSAGEALGAERVVNATGSCP